MNRPNQAPHSKTCITCGALAVSAYASYCAYHLRLITGPVATPSAGRYWSSNDNKG